MGGKAKKQSSYTEGKNRRESGAKILQKNEKGVKYGQKSPKVTKLY